MKYFISSDIHGFFNEWQNALKDKGFDLNNPEHKIILCGDLFDKGNQPKEIIEFVLKHEDKVILIRGNHEDLMEQMIERNSSDYGDLCNGTAQTIVDLYPEWQISEFDLKKIANLTKLQKVLDMCIDYYETKHYIFVHAWIPIVENCYLYDSDWRTARKERWEKARWTNPVEMFRYEIYEPNKTIVCGHWHCSALWHEQNPDEYEEFGDKAIFEPFITKNMIAIDACTTYSHKVNVVVLEDWNK